MKQANHPKIPSRSAFRSLGVSLLLCCLGIGIVLFNQIHRDGNNWFGQSSSDFRSIPPEWITYRQTSVFDSPVEGQPTCFALLNNSTFVVGSANPHTLSLFDEKGTLLRKVNLSEEPRAIACGTDEIIIAHPKQIAVYDAEGNRKHAWKLPSVNSNIRNLVLMSDYLFAVDSDNRRIHRYTLEGHRDLTFDVQDFVVYAAPITMTFSSVDGLLYITNPGKHRVEVFTQDGEYHPELGFGEPSGNLSGFVGCCNPIDVVALNDGRILTVEKSVARIKIYTQDGQLDCVVAGPDVLDNPPLPIQGGRYFSAVQMSDGRIAVFDFDGQRIRLFSPKTNLPVL